jgi:hypothetical protein
VKAHLVNFLKSGGHYERGDQRRSLAYLTAKASNAAYFTPDSIDRSRVARAIYLHRAAHLERVAREREGRPEYALDVAKRRSRATTYLKLAEVAA